MAAPSPPTITSAVNLGSTITVSWSTVSGATGYTISLSPTGQTTSVDGSTLTASLPNTNSGSQLTASVVATNGAGSSAAATKTVDDIGYGMVLWVDAQDSSTMTFSGTRAMNGVTYNTVTQWRDKSGRGNHMNTWGTNQAPIYVPSFTQSVMDGFFVTPKYAPVSQYTSMPAFLKPGLVIRGRHSSATDSLAASLNSRTSPITLFTVVRDWNDGCMFGSTDFNDINFHYSTRYHTVHLWPNNSADGGNNMNTAYAPKSFNGFAINTLYHTNTPSNKLKMRFNGTDNPTSANVTAWANFGNLRIGRNNGETTEGILCEIIIFNRILSSTEMQQVEGYLATKWGIQTNLPASHPYYSTPYTGVPVTATTGLPVVPRTAPVLNTTPTVTLSAIAEDTVSPAGDTVASMIASLGTNYVPFDAADTKGIAIYSAPATNGVWQFSTNSGSSWTDITGLSSSAHILLTGAGTTNKIRFVPAADYNGSASLLFRAWDVTGETAGTVVTISSFGGSTMYSTGTASATLTITGVNDAPVMSGSYTFAAVDAAIGGSPVSIESILSSFTITDVDDANAQATAGLAITYADTAIGTWEYSTDNQATWTAMNAVTATTAVHFSRTASEYIKFTPASTASYGTTSLQIRAWDKTNAGSLLGGVGNASSGGGTTAYSANTFTLGCTVVAAPAAPAGLVSHLTGTNLLLQWTPPTEAGSSAVTSYKVYRVAGNGVRTLEKTIAASATEATIDTNLTPAETYSFVVAAVNTDGGEGASTAPVNVAYAVTPGEPTNVSVVSGNGSITVSWTAPISTGGGAGLTYRIYNTDTSTVLADVSGGATSATVTGLTNFTPQRVYVVAVNDGGLMSFHETPVVGLPFVEDGTKVVGITGAIQSIYDAGTNVPGTIGGVIKTLSQSPTASLPELVKGVTDAVITNVCGSGNGGSGAPVSSKVAEILQTVDGIAGELAGQGGLIQTVVRSSVDGIVKGVISEGGSVATATGMKNTIVEILGALDGSSALPGLKGDAVKQATETILTSPSVAADVALVTSILVGNAQPSVKGDVFGTLAEQKPAEALTLSTALTTLVKDSIPAENKTTTFTETASLLVKVPSESYTVTITEQMLDKPIYIPMKPDTEYTVLYGSSSTKLLYNSAENALYNMTTKKVLNSILELNASSFKILQTGTTTVAYIPPTPTPPPSGGGGQIPCIVKGQRVLTPEGYVPIETLQTGDLITTPDGRAVPVRMYTFTIASSDEKTAPIRIPAGAFGTSYPPKEIILSPLHAIKKNKLAWEIPVHAMKRYPVIKQEPLGEEVVYYHIETPNYLKDLLVVEGSVIDSFGMNFMKRHGYQTVEMYTFSKRLMGYTRFTPSLKVAQGPSKGL